MKGHYLGYFATALIGFLLGAWLVQPKAQPVRVEGRQGSPQEIALAAAAEAVAAAVVSIKVSTSSEVDPLDLSRSAKPSLGEGSGVGIRADGYLLTNHHVVAKAKRIKVSFPDRDPLSAEVVGSDPFTDLAVLKVEADDLPFLAFGDSEAVQVGEWLVAVGNPYGFGHSVTVGVLSSRGRTLEAPGRELTGLLQTDAAINPGNSGGPLANLEGEIIGINTAIIPFGQGIGFAVPSETASRVATLLIEKGEVIRSYLGLRGEPVSQASAELLGLPSVEGLIVTELERDGPAHSSGLKKGDVLLTVDGESIEGALWLRDYVSFKPPGSEVELRYFRKGQAQTTRVTLEKWN